MVVFENKIEAPEGGGQLQNHERYLRERPEQRERRTPAILIWDRNCGKVMKVRQLNCLKAQEDSLHEAYLDFFKEALTEALSASDID